MNHGPYIGITGITSRDQIDAIVEGWPADAPPLAMGVLGSYKTLILRQQNKHPKRYPRAEDIRGIFSTDHRVRNVLHYSFAEDDRQRTATQLVDELESVREVVDGQWLSEFWLQVNARPMIRPWQAGALARVAPQWGRIIVQVSGAAMDLGRPYLQTALDPLWLFASEKSAVTLLFDASGGKGVPLDIARVAPLIELCHRGFGFACGVAGGLSPETLRSLRPLFDICPLSVDAESWPRDSDDRLDIAKAIAFRDAARELYR